MSDQMMKKIKELVYDELNNASKKFGCFNSTHEGYAVIKEELEESRDEMHLVKTAFKGLWNCVMSNFYDGIAVQAGNMKKHACNLIYESIQLAAMIERFERDILCDGDKNV